MTARILLIALLALPVLAQSQEPRKEPEKEKRVYKLDYVIAELESGKRTDTREYTMLVEGGSDRAKNNWGRVRVGTRIPVVTNVAGNATIQFLDVGVNIDALVRSVDESSVGLTTKVEGTSVISAGVEAEKLKTAAGQPTMRQFRTENEVRIPFAKPVVLFTMDEPNSKRSFQVLVTATLVR